MTLPILHDYWCSSAAYRVRVALALKGIDYERRTVDLAKDETEAITEATHAAEHRALTALREHQERSSASNGSSDGSANGHNGHH